MSIVGKVVVFKNDDEYADAETLVEVTDVNSNGAVEVAFDIPGKNLRVYVTINVGALVHETLCTAVPAKE